MLAVLSGGGTAGHINPALALAEEMTARGWEVRFAGTPDGVEARLVPAAGVPFTAFEASGFDRAHLLSLPRGVAKIAASTAKARKWFREIEPDVVVGFGGYVSIPVARAAEQLGIPVVLHEQNSVAGMANRYLAKKAEAVCLTYEHARAGLPEGASVRLTGNPVRRQVVEADRASGRALFGLGEDDFMLLVFGGSLGARHINQAVIAMKDDLLARPHLHVVHITGPKELDAVREALALTPDEERRWHVMGYQDRMGETMAAADAIVSRAGATSLAEISALAIPAVLVPFPYATEDHQTTNACSYVEAGCAFMVPDAELETESFARAVSLLIDDEAVREAQRDAARAQKTTEAAAMLADVVEAAAQPVARAVQ